MPPHLAQAHYAMIKSITFFVLFIFSSLTIHAQNIILEDSSIVYSISLTNLITTPEKYHNEKVMVTGYLNLEFEGNGIYLSEADYLNNIHKNGLWVSFGKDLEIEPLVSFNKKHVSIIGTFDMNDKGHFGLWSGAIIEISLIDFRVK